MRPDLDSGYLCRREILPRSRFSACATRRCHLPAGHEGKCQEMPFLVELSAEYPKVAEKIERDSVMTTGAAWKSEEAGPNRILRWVMLSSDDDLLELGINMAALQDQVINKLREKAATYDECIEVAMWLTRSVYDMEEAPEATGEILAYLEQLFGPRPIEHTTCVVCRDVLPFSLFAEARRGKATIETCHKDPRVHTAENVGFAHRECNIAQGAKTLDEFYDWVEQILRRVKPEMFVKDPPQNSPSS